MKKFLKAWARGVSIGAYYFCLSIVVSVLGFIGEILPPVVSVLIAIVLGPPIIYWVSKWIAPDLFPEERLWWRRRFHQNDK